MPFAGGEFLRLEVRLFDLIGDFLRKRDEIATHNHTQVYGFSLCPI
jgi:hypothetical protein